jgi:hypothetical protein
VPLPWLLFGGLGLLNLGYVVGRRRQPSGPPTPAAREASH